MKTQVLPRIPASYNWEALPPAQAAAPEPQLNGVWFLLPSTPKSFFLLPNPLYKWFTLFGGWDLEDSWTWSSFMQGKKNTIQRFVLKRKHSWLRQETWVPVPILCDVECSIHSPGLGFLMDKERVPKWAGGGGQEHTWILRQHTFYSAENIITVIFKRFWGSSVLVIL